MQHYSVTVRDLAHARSGDKGSNANIGVIAYSSQSYEILCRHLTAEVVTAYFQPLGVEETRRYELPNLMALNFVLKHILDGGGSRSLRLDAQGKALGQALLDMPLLISQEEWQHVKQLSPLQKSELITVDSPHPAYCVVTLNRSDKRNALNQELVEALSLKIEELNNSSQYRVIVLKGAGSIFCAGMDLQAVADEEGGSLMARLLVRLFTAIYNSPHVTIAAVHGAVLAGGVGLIAAADFVVAASNTRFALPETRRGLVAAQVMTLLMRQIAPRFIKEMVLTGEPVDAAWAKQTGLINRVVEEGELMQEVEKLVLSIIQGGEEAVAETKAFCDYIYPSPFTSDLERAQACLIQRRQSLEAQEGISAFLEKRLPNWLHTSLNQSKE